MTKTVSTDEPSQTVDSVDDMLDIALEGTFPASDPVSIRSAVDTPNAPMPTQPR